MKAFYTAKSKLFIVGLFILGFNSSVNAQTTCNTFASTSCTAFGASSINFTASSENFSGSGGIAYNGTNGNFEATTVPGGPYNYVVTSRIFVLQGDVIAIGFNTTGSDATLNSYTVEVVRNSDGTVLGSCVTNTPTAGPICYGIQDADFTAGTEVRFRITINASNAGAVNQTVIFDDFTFNASQAIVLPVSITNFNAKRNSNNVNIEWTTASESNISGFEIQKRDNGTSNFSTVAYIASKATNGNSSSTLQYSFTDNNTSANASFYRIKSIDKNGQAKYSEIRNVDGLKNKAKALIYPNPSKNETVNVVFSSDDQKDIQLTDIQGREIRNWKSYKGNSLKLENLVNGIYMLRINNLVTSEKEIQKIVVSSK